MNIHLVSFGTTANYGGALTRVKIQASQWQDQGQAVFKSVNVFDEKILQRDHQDFCNAHANFINSNPRGFGYWLWKSYLIGHVMSQLPDDDLVLWMDAGCQLNFRALPRFREYGKLAQQHGALCFDVGMPESMWTKGDTARRIAGNSVEHMNSGQLIGTISLWRNDPFNRQLVRDWYNIGMEDGYRYITDVASVAPNSAEFREHRHDQSIVSLLIKKHGRYHALLDETYFANWHQDGEHMPIWATRNPTSIFI